MPSDLEQDTPMHTTLEWDTITERGRTEYRCVLVDIGVIGSVTPIAGAYVWEVWPPIGAGGATGREADAETAQRRVETWYHDHVPPVTLAHALRNLITEAESPDGVTGIGLRVALALADHAEAQRAAHRPTTANATDAGTPEPGRVDAQIAAIRRIAIEINHDTGITAAALAEADAALAT